MATADYELITSGLILCKVQILTQVIKIQLPDRNEILITIINYHTQILSQQDKTGAVTESEQSNLKERVASFVNFVSALLSKLSTFWTLLSLHCRDIPKTLLEDIFVVVLIRQKSNRPKKHFAYFSGVYHIFFGEFFALAKFIEIVD